MRHAAPLLAVLLLPGLALAEDPGEVLREPVAFVVENPAEPGVAHTVRGDLYRPASAPHCASSVLLLLHGFTYGAWGWDLPGHGNDYSAARALAARGHAVVTLDQLGTGRSDRPNGHTITLEGLASMAHQVVQALRSGTYEAPAPVAFAHVGLGGHSMGAAVAEHAAGVYGNVDVLVPMAFTQQARPPATPAEVADLALQAGTQDYVTQPAEQRTRFFYNTSLADPAVIDLDNALAEPGPSGHFVTTIVANPNRAVLPLVQAPVLLVLAEQDAIFHVEDGTAELALFAGTADKTLHVVPHAGHSFMLHRNAAAANGVLAAWLEARPMAMPRC